MKLVVQIVAALLISGLIGWAAYNPTDLRHKAFGTTREENDKIWRDAGFETNQSPQSSSVRSKSTSAKSAGTPTTKSPGVNQILKSTAK